MNRCLEQVTLQMRCGLSFLGAIIKRWDVLRNSYNHVNDRQDILTLPFHHLYFKVFSLNLALQLLNSVVFDCSNNTMYFDLTPVSQSLLNLLFNEV